MNQNQQEQKVGARETFNLLCVGVKAHAMCFLPFIRCDFGTEAFGVPAFLALPLMLIYSALARVPEMMPYLGLWFLALIIQRGRTFRLVRQGVVWHSRYEGTPWLALRFTRKQSKAIRLVEPLLCLLAGGVLYLISPGLGGFVMAGFCSLAIVDALNREVDRRQLAAMRDGVIDGKWLAARYRGQVDE